MSLLGLLMNAFSGLPHLLGELSGSRQNAVEQGLGTRSPPHRHNLYLSLLTLKPRAAARRSLGLDHLPGSQFLRAAFGTEAPNIRLSG